MKAECKIFLLLCYFLTYVTIKSGAQFKISGTVYDSHALYPIESVSVLSSSGKGVATNVYGYYEIIVNEKDSIWFSYLGKTTSKFPVADIKEIRSFDISIEVGVVTLKEVKVRPANYRLDSIQNRIDYAKVFNYEKPTLNSIITAISITGISIDLDELIRAFQVRKIKTMQKFQQRLLQKEREKFIEYRFSKSLVSRLTQLKGEELDSFMCIHRPSYEFTQYTSDYTFQEYIIREYEKYKLSK